MNLNGREIYESDIVIIPQIEGVTDPNLQIQQVGVDLTLKQVNRVNGTLFVYKESKNLPLLEVIEPILDDGGRKMVYLPFGGYDIEFNEGCNIPKDHWLQIKQRSTFLRGLALLQSSVFDPGFSTENMGTVLFVFNPQGAWVEIGCRVGQAIVSNNTPVQDEDLYGSESKGSSYQNDNQRDDN